MEKRSLETRLERFKEFTDEIHSARKMNGWRLANHRTLSIQQTSCLCPADENSWPTRGFRWGRWVTAIAESLCVARVTVASYHYHSTREAVHSLTKFFCVHTNEKVAKLGTDILYSNIQRRIRLLYIK